MKKLLSGNEIRQQFIDFFVDRGHTFVPSSSLVPGGDQTLLFTNAGMVQFKDVFLGTDRRPYTRATDSQKCMRVSGKHNDLDDVGRDNTHHTFFEMLGNWSFGDYYKKEAIAWAWELFTEVWHLPKDNLWATCFKDEQGEIETDEEAAGYWRQQPGIDSSHVLYSGRKDNFWEMADKGPCGPCSEIHLDRGPDFCNMNATPGHICQVNGDCTRFLELWNLVFIQYNRTGARSLEPLPAKHVDTGMGFERIVSVLQNVDSNYKTDLIKPLMDTIQKLTGDDDAEREAHITPYRVISDHARAAAFLIADGVVPGNTGRSYECRMIIRRAARFGGKIGLTKPFLAKVAEIVIENYGDFYPELKHNSATILDNLTREEQRFQRTLESGMTRLENQLKRLETSHENILPGELAFELYATYGLPLQITRDVAREQGYTVDEKGFNLAKGEHSLASGAGEAFGPLGGEDVAVYRALLADLQEKNKLGPEGVEYDPYNLLEVEGQLLALIKGGVPVQDAQAGDKVEIILPETGFYVESGGQVSDTGKIVSTQEPHWEISISDMRKPAAGIVVHVGEVVYGNPKVGDPVVAAVDEQRRRDIMRNHTATHLLHAALRAILGEHARQAGSLVAPDRLRFDFNHPEGITDEQLERIEAEVNRDILAENPLTITLKPRQVAMNEGAMALFGEKYGDTVRTIAIGLAEPFSYELCGGTHVSNTIDLGLFLITSEGSAASGIRRIEAVTGRRAYELVQRRLRALKHTAGMLTTSPENVPAKTEAVIQELASERKMIASLKRDLALLEFNGYLNAVPIVAGVPVLTAVLPAVDADTLRQLADRFRANFSSGCAVLASVEEGCPIIIACVSDDLVKRGLHAGELVKFISQPLGGGGGGKPTLAQAGGKDASRLDEALAGVAGWVEQKLIKT
jgi:alanyl-tRNA synthetase